LYVVGIAGGEQKGRQVVESWASMPCVDHIESLFREKAPTHVPRTAFDRYFDNVWWCEIAEALFPI